MSLRTRMVIGCGLVALLLGLGGGLAADQAADQEEGARRGHHREIRWLDQDGGRLGSGLYLIRTRDDFFSARVLAETPDGSRFVMSQTLDPRTGIDETTLLDDAGGWWVRLTKDVGVAEETLHGFFQAAERALPVGEGIEVSVRVRTQDGFDFEAPVVVQEPRQVHWSFLERLAAAGSVAALSDSIPPALREAILFLDGSLSPEPLPSRSPDDGLAHSLRGPVEVLAGALRQAPPEGLSHSGRPAVIEMGPPTKGLTLADPATLDLVAGFRSVSAHRLLPQEPPP